MQVPTGELGLGTAIKIWVDLGLSSVLYSRVSGAAWDVFEWLGHLPRAGGGWRYGPSLGDTCAGLVGCFRAPERAAEIDEQANGIKLNSLQTVEQRCDFMGQRVGVRSRVRCPGCRGFTDF